MRRSLRAILGLVSGCVMAYAQHIVFTMRTHPSCPVVITSVSPSKEFGFEQVTLLDDSGKTDEAIAEYKEALKLQPKNASTHYNLSIVYQKKKDMPAAIAELKEAARLAPDILENGGLRNRVRNKMCQVINDN